MNNLDDLLNQTESDRCHDLHHFISELHEQLDRPSFTAVHAFVNQIAVVLKPAALDFFVSIGLQEEELKY